MTEEVTTVLLGCAHVRHAQSYAAAVSASRFGRLVGVYDESLALGRPLAAAHGARYHPDAQALLEETQPQAAIVCGETSRHRSLVELAAAHGIDVLCEKPLAGTVQDAVAMVDRCRASGVQLHTAFVSRFYPVLRQARALVLDGEIGQVRAMVGGNRGRPPLPPRYPPWITDAEHAGGGALIDHTVHVHDAMRFVTGLEARHVLAETGTLFHDTQVEDSALVSVVFEGDVPASIDPSWSVTSANPWDYDFYLRLLGSEGTLSISTGREAIAVAGRHEGRTYADVSFEPDIDQAMIDAFLQSVIGRRPIEPCASGEDGVRAVELACAAYASTEVGKLVPVREPPHG